MISLKTLQLERASYHVEGRISWFLWSCGGKLRVPLELRGDLGDPLVFPQGSQICFQTRGALQDSSPITAGMNRASSRVEAGTSGFLSSSDRDLGVPMEIPLGFQMSYRVGAWNSTSLSRCKSGVSPPVVLR